MRKFYQHKLWRDEAVNILQKQGSIIHWHMLNDEDMNRELKHKLHEEALEVIQAANNEELKNELADVLEVIETIAVVNNINLAEIYEIKKHKREEKGGFCGRKFVTVAEHQEGSSGERYCLNDPKKYPEIF